MPARYIIAEIRRAALLPLDPVLAAIILVSAALAIFSPQQAAASAAFVGKNIVVILHFPCALDRIGRLRQGKPCGKSDCARIRRPTSEHSYYCRGYRCALAFLFMRRHSGHRRPPHRRRSPRSRDGILARLTTDRSVILRPDPRHTRPALCDREDGPRDRRWSPRRLWRHCAANPRGAERNCAERQSRQQASSFKQPPANGTVRHRQSTSCNDWAAPDV